MVSRLGDLALQLGLGFGVKFSNTLLVRNHKSFFPATETQMYMSGLPLHVLAMSSSGTSVPSLATASRCHFRRASDSRNFADAVALGLKPVTVCSDLLKAGGYWPQHPLSGHAGRTHGGGGSAQHR